MQAIEEMTPETHIAGILEEFTNDATGKYMQGAREHGPGLWRIPNFQELRKEVIDLVNFTYSLGQKRFHCPCGCGHEFTIEELEQAQ